MCISEIINTELCRNHLVGYQEDYANFNEFKKIFGCFMVKPDFIKENNVYLGKIEKNLQLIEEWANNCKAANNQSHKIEEFLNLV